MRCKTLCTSALTESRANSWLKCEGSRQPADGQSCRHGRIHGWNMRVLAGQCPLTHLSYSSETGIRIFNHLAYETENQQVTKKYKSTSIKIEKSARTQQQKEGKVLVCRPGRLLRSTPLSWRWPWRLRGRRRTFRALACWSWWSDRGCADHASASTVWRCGRHAGREWTGTSRRVSYCTVQHRTSAGPLPAMYTYGHVCASDKV